MNINNRSLAHQSLIAGLLTAGAFGASAATVTTASCAQSAVQAAVNSANDGDTVNIPAGTCTWSSAVSLNSKTIYLKGAGSGSGGTKIVHGGGDHTLIQISAGSKRGRLDVSGFWFSGSSANNWNGTAMQVSGPFAWKNLRIHHNVFENNYPWTISIGVDTYGVIDNNTFRGRALGIKTYGREAADWSTPLTLGTSDFFFVEGNTFDMDDWYGSTGTPAVDMFGGGRVVFRHNTGKYFYFGTHDKARSTQVSANAYEVYGNSFWTNSNKWKALDITAGTGVIWGNTISGDWTVPIGAMDYKTSDPRSLRRCDGTDPADQNVAGEAGWRCQYQIGSQGEGASAVGYPLHLWGNTVNGAVARMSCTAGCTHVQDGRDFVNGASAKPGYAPYTYPHPITATSQLPAPTNQLPVPTNLRVQ